MIIMSNMKQNKIVAFGREIPILEQPEPVEKIKWSSWMNRLIGLEVFREEDFKENKNEISF